MTAELEETGKAIARSFPEGERYGFPAYPNGWFRVAYSNELGTGEVRALSYFGAEQVLFRSEDGVARLFDAFCPHLGAHLGVGGTVVRDGLRCPFHGWEFDGAGRCVSVPYARRIPPQAAVRAWPVVERNGVVFAWHHAGGAAPSWEPPLLGQVGQEGWTPLLVKHWKVRARWLDMNENCVDRAHFKYVHGTLSIPTSEVEEREHVFRVSSRFEQKAPGGRTTEGVLVTTDYGPGFQHVEMAGILPSILMNTATPLDEEHCDVSFAYSVETHGDPRAEKLADKIVADLLDQFEHDLPIWENKASWRRPRLCDGDGPIGQYRRWYARFF